jgi:DNA-binding transcriptional regulator PaaX
LEEFEQGNAVKRKMAQKGWIKRESNEQQYSHKIQDTHLRRLKAAANKTRQD